MSSLKPTLFILFNRYQYRLSRKQSGDVYAILMAHIHATPSTALVDETISIRLRGLQPTQSVTIAASLSDDGKKFVSYAHYQTDEKGEIDLQTAVSYGGTYKGWWAIL